MYKQQGMLCIYLEGEQGIIEARKGDSGRRLIARISIAA